MPLLRNIGLLATCRADGGQGAVHPIPRAAVAWDDAGRIRWVGPESGLPPQIAGGQVWDAGGGLVIPGLVDCHTHLAFGGWRADEFEQRILGRSYLEIAHAGGGIAATVAQTRAASTEELRARCLETLQAMARLGVTTVECKSGYGLDRDTELRILQLYRELAGTAPQRLVATYLGAHAVPPEYRDRRAAYVDLLINGMIPAIGAAGLARFCDVFLEQSAFTPDEARRILLAGRAAGLLPKLHADQLTAGGGAELAAEVQAASADHLEFATDEGLRALAAAGTVAVSLPLATLYLQQTPFPARRAIRAGVGVAVATDFNPGSAPSYHLPLAMLLACTLQRMTPAEALKGATFYAARALRLEGEIGSVEPGKAADLAVIDAPGINHWLYHFRPNDCRLAFRGGRVIWQA